MSFEWSHSARASLSPVNTTRACGWGTTRRHLSPTADQHQQAGQRTLANMLAPTVLLAPSSQGCWPHSSKACAGLAEGCSGCVPADHVRQAAPGLRPAQRLRPEAARVPHTWRRLVPTAAAQQTAAKPTPLGSMTAPMRPSGPSGNDHLEGKLKVIGETKTCTACISFFPALPHKYRPVPP